MSSKMSENAISKIQQQTSRRKSSKAEGSSDQELYIFIPVISITFESDLSPADEAEGKSPIPLFLAALGVHGLIQNWSTELNVEGGVNLEMAYFNQYLNVWEPIIEPLEMTDKYKPWEISLNIKTINTVEDEEHPPPKVAIAVVSSDVMQLTITKTYLEMLSKFANDVTKKASAPTAIIRQIKTITSPYVFINALLLNVEISIPDSTFGKFIKNFQDRVTLKSGEFVEMEDVVSVDVKVFANVTFSGSIEFSKTKTSELTAHTFIDLGVRAEKHRNTYRLTLYCPFWMINKTNFPLYYKTSAKRFGWCCCTDDKKKTDALESKVQVHSTAVQPANAQDALMLTFNGKSFFGKSKACLKIGSSYWSKNFPVDTVGSCGRIICKTDDGQMEVSLTIQLSYSGLTKICTFTPFYLIANHCTTNVEVEQFGIDRWLKVGIAEVVPFWPKSKKNRKQLLCARYEGTKEVSLPFPFTENFEALAPIQNEFAGINVCCNISERSVVIALEDFEDGMAPALIVNDCEHFVICYAQEGVERWTYLPYGKSVLFKWEDLAAKRNLLWSSGDSTVNKDTLFQDGTGTFLNKDDSKFRGYWVSFLDSRQRVLMFTEDRTVAYACETYVKERMERQFTFSFHGVGISLVDNIKSMEIAYISVTSSGLIWEYKKKEMHKAMPLKESLELEEAFVLYTNEKLAGKRLKSRQKIGNIEVDFESMHQYMPLDRDLRRTFLPGLWLQYRTSLHQEQLHMKINCIQVDNQLPSCIFPVVFAPVPPPISVVADILPKSFVHLSYVARKAEHSTIRQVNYLEILVQEGALKIDRVFFDAFVKYYYGAEQYSIYTRELFRRDRELMHHDLAWYASVTLTNEQKSFYDKLHFTPIKLHFSYSQAGASTTGQTALYSGLLNLFTKSIGVTLTEVQDVVFKLAYFERKAVFLNRSQLWSECMDHYTSQAIKQAYVLIFGLDIIGNPFGLIRDLSTGVETFFYEPFQGAIQGPEEFAEGLTLGVRSLFRHTVGSTARAVSRITGTLGKGIAALTDKEFQSRRQVALAQRPTGVTERVMHSGKGLLMGVLEGATGIVMKPLEGARQEGVKGFFKGLGKGAVGLVALPLIGVIDFTSDSLESVRRLAGLSSEVKRIRSPRYIQPDHVIRPYNSMEADGNQLLQTAGKGRFSKTDNIKAYLQLTEDKMYFLLVTDKRIGIVSKSTVFGNFDFDWVYTWQELSEPPCVGDKCLMIRLRKTKKLFNFFRKSSSGKMISMPKHAAEWIAGLCKEAYDEANSKKDNV